MLRASVKGEDDQRSRWRSIRRGHQDKKQRNGYRRVRQIHDKCPATGSSQLDIHNTARSPEQASSDPT
ncbi:hypothetical protein PsYK624_166430 [Phanerochaete sordida]|uniref:Uncharacterized protein n=1 Tax=Phanerochaete sordida TaxID=48140 RepID=A0A9P3GSG2_9APHY|nr:hypothetical protein PsYK624_166430 [Phanerochaete sordida]